MPDGKIVAVLRRAIPVEGMLTDTCVKICGEHTSVEDIMAWEKKMCAGSTVSVSLELVRETPQ